jgi:hypothetical protein
LKEARKRTAIADAQLDEEGKTVKKDETEELKNDQGVVMVESRAAHLVEAQNGEPASAGGSSDKTEDTHLVPLKSKPKKKKPRRNQDEDGLF